MSSLHGKRTYILLEKVILFFVLSLLVAGCGERNELVEETQEAYQTELFAMDTYMTFTAYGENAQASLADIKDKMIDLENRWSVTNKHSEIYAINHSRQGADVSKETVELINFALDMAKKTKGALEPTIYPVLEAWGFTLEDNRVPAEKEIERLLKLVGYDRVIVDGKNITLKDGMMLDLGAVGKGYAGELAAEILKEQGITSALLDIGGNIQAIGSKPDGSDWRLGIQSPFGEGTLGVLEISDMAVVTSGNYERFFIGEDGKKYGHIIDPSTGYPADSGLASVTVVAEEGKLCDALSTALFVMGLENAIDYWQTNPGFELILVTEGGEIHLTEGLEAHFAKNGDSEGNIHVIQREA